MAHEGFNWKQQSLLACILFSSRAQRTPIISFLLYCLFSHPRLPESPQPATAPSFPSLRFPGSRAPRSSFEFRAFRLSYVPRTTSVSEFESFAEIHPDLASRGRPVFHRCAMFYRSRGDGISSFSSRHDLERNAVSYGTIWHVRQRCQRIGNCFARRRAQCKYFSAT